MWSKPLLWRFQQSEEIPQTQVSQGFAVFRLAPSRIPPRHSQSKRATNCANPGYEIQTDPTAGCSNSGVCLQMATPQNLTAVHVACRKRTECRRKTILYFTEICRKVKSYIWIIGAAILEPFLYHPLIVAFSIKGYCNFLFNKKAVWGEMSRKGFAGSKKKEKSGEQEKGGES